MYVRLLRLLLICLLCLHLAGCPTLGWLVRASAGRAAITRVATTESTLARSSGSALGLAATRSGITVTQALAMRGATAGLLRGSPIRLAAGESMPVEVYHGNDVVLRATLSRQGHVVTLSDGAGGSIRAISGRDDAVRIVDQADNVLGSAVVDGAEVNLTAADGTTSLGRDILLPELNQIRHLDQTGKTIAITELKTAGTGAKRRLELRLARELVEDLMRDLQQESRFADAAPPPQKPTGLTIEPVSLIRRGNIGLLQTNVLWVAKFRLRNTGEQPVGVALVEAVVAPTDCHTGRSMYVARAYGIHWVDLGNVFDSHPLDMTTIPPGESIAVSAEIACNSFARSLYPMVESPLTVELLVDEAGQRRTLGLGVASIPLRGERTRKQHGPSRQSGPLRLTAIHAARRSQAGLLQGSISWHLVMRIENTVDETLFLTASELTVDALSCRHNDPVLTDEWGLGRIDPHLPTKPDDATRTTMLSLPAFSTAQIAVEFTCTGDAANLAPQPTMSLSGMLLMERGRKFERISVSLDDIPLDIGSEAVTPRPRY
ncbi:MAG: hypothetical protein E6Q88_11555 [Lysobacteraceae bacterium]|nr:MAG: hypothetical protein E6Q88_11555 [Xanthomonadaceae bacterium]